jgi:hypothetical protein
MPTPMLTPEGRISPCHSLCDEAVDLKTARSAGFGAALPRHDEPRTVIAAGRPLQYGLKPPEARLMLIKTRGPTLTNTTVWTSGLSGPPARSVTGSV